jgi:hypothetical protein
MMIKLTEVVCEPGSYNATTHSVDSKYKLKNLYINPKFVVELRESEEYIQKHSTKKLIGGLSDDIGFTKLTVSTGGNWSKTYNIVGYPAQVLGTLKGNT